MTTVGTLGEMELREIVDQFADRIYNHAYRMMGKREDAEEVTQDVFLRIHRGLSTFRGDAQLATWIWRITTNVCLSRRRKRPLSAISLDDDCVNLQIESVGAETNPDKLVHQNEIRERLARLIALMPEREAIGIRISKGTMFHRVHGNPLA